ncbi:hypothetical protein AB0K18_43175 [Nonomuraea sp. NPDC049421]|uniref:hypothetical protein n=1 Tax=Nonomuraea sp. NPDC049421 TaxID=3155275 RepID=UPI003437C2EC
MADRDLQRVARRRQNATGEDYQVALNTTRAAWQRLDNQLRYTLSDDVTAFMRGEGWRGITLDDVEDMRTWLAHRKPTYECDWCDGDGDVRREDTSLQLIVAAYDPDLSPVTAMLGSRRYHARCRPSKVTWADKVDIPRGPRAAALPASARPEIEAEIAVTAQAVWVPALLDFEPQDAPYAASEPALLISVEVADDRGQGAGPWLTELELALWRPSGFDEIMANKTAESGWSVRVVDGYPSSAAPQWVAVRMSAPEDGAMPDHLYLGALDIQEEWRMALDGRKRLLVVVGPLQVGGAAPEIPGQPDADQLAELLEEGVLLAAYMPVELDARGGTPEPESR